MSQTETETPIPSSKNSRGSSQGRPKPSTKKTYTVTKFVLSVCDSDKDSIDFIGKKLVELNDKDFGKEVKFSDMALYAIRKLDQQDIKDLKLKSVKKSDVAELALQRYNSQNNENLSQEDIVLKFLKSDTKEVLNELSK